MPSSESRALLASIVILTAATVLGAFRWECWSDQKVHGPLLDYDLWNDTLAHSNVNFGGKVYCPIGVCYMAPIRSDESIQINFGCVDPNKDAIFKSLHIKDTNFTPIWHARDYTDSSVKTPRSAKYYCSVLSNGARPCNDPLVIFNAIGEAKKDNEQVFNDIGVFMRAREEDNTTSIYFSTEKESEPTTVPIPEGNNPTDDATGSVEGETTALGDNQESSMAVVTNTAASAAQGTSTTSSASDAVDGAAAAEDEKTSTRVPAVDGVTSASPSTVAPSQPGPVEPPSGATSDHATNLNAAAVVSTTPKAADTTPAPTFPENAADLGGNGDVPGPSVATDTNAATEIPAAPEQTPAGGPNAAAATRLFLALVPLLAVIRLF